jgi:hypothetical protein
VPELRQHHQRRNDLASLPPLLAYRRTAAQSAPVYIPSEDEGGLRVLAMSPSTKPLLPDSVLDQIIACNRFKFAFKPLFYCLKDALITQYGTFDGYDHQHFWKYKHYWAQFYHYDMTWTYNEATPPHEWKEHLAEVWSKSPDEDYFETSEREDDMRIIWSNDAMVRCVSEHRHILERWQIHGETRVTVMHRPLNEFFYRAYKTDRHEEIVKHSPRFFELAAQCKDQFAHVGDDKPENGIKPFREFKQLVRWMSAEQPALRGELHTKLTPAARA